MTTTTSTTTVPQIAAIQATVLADQEQFQAKLVQQSSTLAEGGARFADSRTADILRTSGILAGLTEIEWRLRESVESTEPLPVIVAQLLLELGGIQGATAEGVNLRQKSPDFIEGKVAAARSISQRLVDMLRDTIRDAELGR